MYEVWVDNIQLGAFTLPVARIEARYISEVWECTSAIWHDGELFEEHMFQK